MAMLFVGSGGSLRAQTYYLTDRIPSLSTTNDGCREIINNLQAKWSYEDNLNKDELNNRLHSAESGWREINPGTCRAGGPPPTCERNHWEQVGRSAAMAAYDAFNRSVAEKRAKEGVTKLNSCTERLQLEAERREQQEAALREQLRESEQRKLEQARLKRQEELQQQKNRFELERKVQENRNRELVQQALDDIKRRKELQQENLRSANETIEKMGEALGAVLNTIFSTADEKANSAEKGYAEPTDEREQRRESIENEIAGQFREYNTESTTEKPNHEIDDQSILESTFSTEEHSGSASNLTGDDVVGRLQKALSSMQVSAYSYLEKALTTENPEYEEIHEYIPKNKESAINAGVSRFVIEPVRQFVKRYVIKEYESAFKETNHREITDIEREEVILKYEAMTPGGFDIRAATKYARTLADRSWRLFGVCLRTFYSTEDEP
jgi:hypothetical protein